MATHIANTRKVFKDTFNINVKYSMFNLNDNSFKTEQLCDDDLFRCWRPNYLGKLSPTFHSPCSRHRLSSSLVVAHSCLYPHLHVIYLIVNFDKYNARLCPINYRLIALDPLRVFILPLKLIPSDLQR